MADIMLDLETLGTTPGCVIRSIGAVAFDPNGGPMGETLYLIIDRASCEAAGLTVDPDTEAWWAAQSPEARSEFDGQGMALSDALNVFNLFYETLAPIDAKADRLWCNGPSFDESILAAAYHALGRKTPWRYNAARDCRTIYDLAGLKLQHTGGTFHKAIDDAVEQAKLVQEARRQLVAAEGPAWRPEVVAFADLMEQQLRANDHKGGWKGDTSDALYQRLLEEAEELSQALAWRSALFGDADPDRIGREAADVANFAMMIADASGALGSEARP
ncbi:3'-5' exoribonuclease [Caulobacter sp. SL161]|uniref:3'-5' exoribonuclease domain-containing protein n=1 Tax=Caulobacter sp. SL161 TaxID=2995156 RepID=UPI002275681B|nr:3'-5' exoribonuclease [Caulobacter sp. SL161]MCY1649110.1 3'-5' exoribonuclease [Caulobacter sp. SL161]